MDTDVLLTVEDFKYFLDTKNVIPQWIRSNKNYYFRAESGLFVVGCYVPIDGCSCEMSNYLINTYIIN